MLIVFRRRSDHAPALAGGLLTGLDCLRRNSRPRAIGEGRARFMALWGIFSSLCFFCAILFNIIASVTVPLCVA